MSSPEIIIKAGNARAVVFRNSVIKNGEKIAVPKVLFEIRYKDRLTGKWQATNSMTLHEIPKAVLVLVKAYSYLLTNSQ